MRLALRTLAAFPAAICLAACASLPSPPQSGPSTSTSTAPSLDTVIIFSHNPDRLADFYARGLGLTDRQSHPGHRGYQVGACYLGFDEARPDAGVQPGATTIWITVADLQSTFDRMRDLGATIKSEPHDLPWGACVASVLDPDGNTLGLSQRR